jgi:glycosyltransferase involved in cell wall biosynthesis
MQQPALGLSAKLAGRQRPIKVIYISSYIPMRCGIATFTKDLTNAVNSLNPHALAEIVAMNDEVEAYEFPWEVKLRVGQGNPQDYSMAAHYINQSSTDVVNLQHEFGIFGGVSGDYLLPLLDSIEKPLITNFHTILPEPDTHEKYVMERIIERSAAVVAMTESSRRILLDVYGCPPEKAVVIHHGVPDFTFNGIATHKKRLRIAAEPMILMAGLLGPSKGFEHMIDAMPAIVKHAPNAKLYVVGQTHPHVLRHEGEQYRNRLKQQARAHKVQKNVVFVNRYVNDDELRQYYLAADFFVTPYPGMQQPTSGTLAWAVGAGKVCISTPYHYAREILSDGTGILVPALDSAALAKAVVDVCKDAGRQLSIRQLAYRKGRQMTWFNTGLKYLNLFELVHQAQVTGATA